MVAILAPPEKRHEKEKRTCYIPELYCSLQFVLSAFIGTLFPYCVETEDYYRNSPSKGRFHCLTIIVNTIFILWYFSKSFKCLVYESSCEEETPFHSVLLSLLHCHALPLPRLSAVLSTCFSSCSPPLRLSHHLSLPHSCDYK